jgi:uroporphyrin-III C-methyltransferase
MGMNRMASLAASLLAHLPADTPAAIVQSASQPNEAQLLTTLGRLTADAHRTGLGSPGVILVGAALATAMLSAAPVDAPIRAVTQA